MNCPINIKCDRISLYKDMCFECMKKRILKAQEITKKLFPNSSKRIIVGYASDDHKLISFRGKVSIGDMYVTEDTNEEFVYCGEGKFESIGEAP